MTVRLCSHPKCNLSARNLAKKHALMLSYVRQYCIRAENRASGSDFGESLGRRADFDACRLESGRNPVPGTISGAEAPLRSIEYIWARGRSQPEIITLSPEQHGLQLTRLLSMLTSRNLMTRTHRTNSAIVGRPEGRF